MICYGEIKCIRYLTLEATHVSLYPWIKRRNFPFLPNKRNRALLQLRNPFYDPHHSVKGNKLSITVRIVIAFKRPIRVTEGSAAVTIID